MRWFLIKDGRRVGPFRPEEIRAKAETGELRPSDTLVREGETKPVPAGRIRGLNFGSSTDDAGFPPLAAGDVGGAAAALSAPGGPPPLATAGQPFPANADSSVPLGQNAGVRLLLPVGRSVWAVIAGYLGLLSLLLLPAPLAILFSIIAIVDIIRSRRNPHPKHGLGRAIFGLIMGLVGCVGLAVAIAVFLAQK